jgi:hypothetical protein
LSLKGVGRGKLTAMSLRSVYVTIYFDKTKDTGSPRDPASLQHTVTTDIQPQTQANFP